MKENRTCRICPETFWTKITSNRKTCSNKCSIAYRKVYNQTPKVKARQKEYRERPEHRVKQKKYRERPEYKAQLKKYSEKPEYEAKRKKSSQLFYQKHKKTLLENQINTKRKYN